MKNITRNVTGLIVSLTLVLFSFCGAGPAFGETLKKVAVIPLEMNATEDLTFLQKGLFTMLSSRLADPGKVEIFDRETIDKTMANAPEGPLNEDKARQIGTGLNADYVLFGSLTMFGKSVSLDMSMVDVKAASPTLTFSKQAPEPGAVITELDQIAAEINFKTFGREPEQILPKEAYVQAQQQAIPQGGGYVSPLTNYRSLWVANGLINGISIADVDGDKEKEVVAIYSHAIEILKYLPNGQLKPVKRIEDGQYADIVGMDAADINGNGKAEIFVSRVLRETGYVKSYVLEFDGTAFKKIAEDLSWYLRAVKEFNGKGRLYGQESGRLGPYKGNAFDVVWENGRYVKGVNLRVPDGFTVMSLATGYTGGSNISGSLFTDEKGRLTLFSDTGRVEWSGEDGFGGSKLYYEFMETDKIVQNIAEGRGVFFQPRNLVADLDTEGVKNVIVIKNEDSADNLFQEVRNYKSGSIQILRWSEMGLSPETAPKMIPGQVTDIALENKDNSSKVTLMVSLIKKRNNFSTENSRSMIIAYDLN